MMSNIARVAFGMFIVLSIVQHIYYYPRLPERVATHFGIDGQPDQWSSRSAATVTFLVLQVVLPLSMLGVAYLTRFLPTSMINIPNREYWLHADRRAETIERIDLMMWWFALILGVFLMIVAHLTFQANVSEEKLNSGLMTIAIFVLLALIGYVIFMSMRPFRSVKPE